MADRTAANTGVWASTIASASKKDFRDIRTNDDLMLRMTLPACFKQCSRTDIDLVLMDEMECTYKCMITYKDTMKLFRKLDHQ